MADDALAQADADVLLRMENVSTTDNLINRSYDWLKAKTSRREISDWVEITTPYLDRHNDDIQIYLKRQDGEWVLTDDGYTLADLALLEAQDIEWRLPQPSTWVAREQESSRLSTDEKDALFRRLFRGRTDVYAIRWESKTTGKAGYAPACANEWRAGVCEKPRIKCGKCSHRLR